MSTKPETFEDSASTPYFQTSKGESPRRSLFTGTESRRLRRSNKNAYRTEIGKVTYDSERRKCNRPRCDDCQATGY